MQNPEADLPSISRNQPPDAKKMFQAGGFWTAGDNQPGDRRQCEGRMIRGMIQ
jgi:hypothetical protein